MKSISAFTGVRLASLSLMSSIAIAVCMPIAACGDQASGQGGSGQGSAGSTGAGGDLGVTTGSGAGSGNGSGSGGGAGGMGGGAGGMGGGAGGMGGGAGGMSGEAGGGGAGGMGGPTLPPIADYSDEGPFDTVVERNVGPNGAYTVFRPEPLGTDGFLHAPIIFGPGIGQQVAVHTTMLTNFASHGFVVVGSPVLNGGPGDEGNRKKMEDGLNWILEQNDAPGKYQGKLYVDHAVSMGFSVGGTSAVQLGGHEAVATVVSIHGHRASADLHGTMLQTTGTQDTVGMPLQQATYDMSEVPTFLATLTGAPHQYIERDGGGEERPAIVAWMRYWIYNDMGARDHFFGDDCVLCKQPWENPQRKNWE
ncbi:hypothetical protein [Sorangium sp. So ce394]|uniref:hypothetical protein n=1 Tax=Sorangium sp. So ce394 TaxID=3133310 RepID=UPI003F5BAFD7